MLEQLCWAFFRGQSACGAAFLEHPSLSCTVVVGDGGEEAGAGGGVCQVGLNRETIAKGQMGTKLLELEKLGLVTLDTFVKLTSNSAFDFLQPRGPVLENNGYRSGLATWCPVAASLHGDWSIG